MSRIALSTRQTLIATAGSMIAALGLITALTAARPAPAGPPAVTEE